MSALCNTSCVTSLIGWVGCLKNQKIAEKSGLGIGFVCITKVSWVEKYQWKYSLIPPWQLLFFFLTSSFCVGTANVGSVRAKPAPGVIWMSPSSLLSPKMHSLISSWDEWGWGFWSHTVVFFRGPVRLTDHQWLKYPLWISKFLFLKLLKLFLSVKKLIQRFLSTSQQAN